MQATENKFLLVRPEHHNEGPAIAIDLGTSYAYVAVNNNDKVEILKHSNGERAFPCYISFTEDDRLIGSEAKALAISNAQNTVFDFKRLLGRAFTDPLVQQNLKHWPFKVEADDHNRPVVVVTHKGEVKKFHPEELTAMVLIRLKEEAEKFLKVPVKRAVITVPAYFRDGQREATRDAASIAGLNVLRLVNEPSASAVAHVTSKNFPKGEVKLVVYEFGAGTFDASVVNIEDNFIQIISTVGDTHLGAEDLDNKLVEVCVEHLKKTSGVDLSKEWVAKQKLKKEVSKVRKVLSSENESTISIDDLVPGTKFELKITREEWEKHCETILQKTITLTKKALEDAKITADNVSMVVLAGGATHSPAVPRLVKEAFPGKEVNRSIDPDQAVIMGAGILAIDISGDSKVKHQNPLLLINVLPMSLGIQTENGAMCTLLPRDTSIPTVRKHTFTTTEDNQEALIVTIYEGQNKLVKDNNILGKFTLTGIPPLPKGEPAIEVALHVDADGILSVKAYDKVQAKELETPVLKWTLTKQEVDKLREDGFYYEETHLPKKPSKMDEID